MSTPECTIKQEILEGNSNGNDSENLNTTSTTQNNFEPQNVV